MNTEWNMVSEFHEKFHHPVGATPQQLNPDRVGKRYTWMLEELDEFRTAPDLVEQADAMIDLIYFALGTLVEMGVAPDAPFEIVHHANMAKLWADGLPHYAPDGKTIKPAGWQDPHSMLEQAIIGQE